MTAHSEQIIQHIRASVPMLQREYQRGVNRDLSLHRWQGILERQLLAVIERYLCQCTETISNAPKPIPDGETTEDTTILFRALADIKDQLITHALSFNRSSCALSNFGEEHVPGTQYLEQILTQVETRWAQWHAEQCARG